MSALLLKAKDIEIIEGFKVGRDGEAITHLQFADDTIRFSSSNWDEIVLIKRILRCFELASGLKVNLHKSILMGGELF